MEALSSFLINAGAFVVIISVIVFIHEYGHYYIAKINGVGIEVFSIGFGPELVGWNDKSGTRWKICGIPLGGYVKMAGDINPASMPDFEQLEELSEEEKNRAFHLKSLWVKTAVVAAGPIANFLLAIVIFTFLFSYYGKPQTLPIVSEVMPGGVAEEVGLKTGDTILELDGSKVETFEDIRRIVTINPGLPIDMIYLRDNIEYKITITPRLSETKDVFGNVIRVGLLGIRSSAISQKQLGVPEAFVVSIKETYHLSVGMLSAIGQMVTGKRGTEDLGGVIRIAQYSGQSAQVGISMVLWLTALISVNLGLINLFPIPVLDGGHLMYYAIEALRGKPMAEKYQLYGFRFGLALVVALVVFATYNDLRHLGVF